MINVLREATHTANCSWSTTSCICMHTRSSVRQQYPRRASLSPCVPPHHPHASTSCCSIFSAFLHIVILPSIEGTHTQYPEPIRNVPSDIGVGCCTRIFVTMWIPKCPQTDGKILFRLLFGPLAPLSFASGRNIVVIFVHFLAALLFSRKMCSILPAVGIVICAVWIPFAYPHVLSCACFFFGGRVRRRSSGYCTSEIFRSPMFFVQRFLRRGLPLFLPDRFSAQPGYHALEVLPVCTAS